MTDSCLVDPREFDLCVRKLRNFFSKKGFLECHPQSGLSILAACEDPTTIATYNYAGNLWPLPQTGQMWLEHELLKNPSLPGLFSVSTSFRNEPNPVPGRHDLIFPMFEFEMKGYMSDLIQLEKELLMELGFGKHYNESGRDFPEGDYADVANQYQVKELQHQHETQLNEDYGPVYFLKNFPEYTSPFWNMKYNTNAKTANKVDVILHGVETIGSAERETDKSVMRDLFNTISDGKYAQTLFGQFGKQRVSTELDRFLSFDFFPRVGGCIGMTRMIRALKLSNLL